MLRRGRRRRRTGAVLGPPGPPTRRLYPDWERAARTSLAHLPATSGRYPDDPGIAALVGELSAKGPDFARWWAHHDVQEKGSGRKELCHPTVGPARLDHEALDLSDGGDQRLVTYRPADEASAAVLEELLADATPARRLWVVA